MRALWEFLLSTELPDNASLRWGELIVRGRFPIWAAVALGLLAAVVAVVLYFKEAGKLGVGRRLALASLRTFAVWLLLFLILRPSFIGEFHGEKPRGIVVLIDNSQSLQQRDRRLSPIDQARVALALNRQEPGGTALPTDPSRVEMIRAVLRHPSLDLPLEQHGGRPTRQYLFGGQLRGLGDGTTGQGLAERLAMACTADEPNTALADSLFDLLQRTESDLPSAVVVVTDGRDTASKRSLDEAARECARLGVPLHIYGVGSTEGGLLQIKEVASPENVFSEDTVSVPVRWRNQGLKSGKVVLTMTLGGKEVARKEVDAHEGEELRETLSFKPPRGLPAEQQKQELVVSVQLRDNDVFRDSVSRPVRVLDRKVRVLFVENAPRWEYKFLMQSLLRDERRVEVRVLLAQADADTLKSGPPYVPAFPDSAKELFAYDLVILGDVPASFLGPKNIETLRQFVSEGGGGLVMIAGRQHAPASFKGTALEPMLPVDFPVVSFKLDEMRRPEAFSPVPSPVGQRNEMLSLADTPEENARVWRELPGFFWHYPVTKLRPGALSLLDHPKQRAGDGPMPLIASHYYGKGIVLFLGLDETWRWRFNEQEKYFGRFWGQVIYQVGLPHTLGSKRAQLVMEQPDNVLGRQGQVYARLLDTNYQPLRADRVTARLERLDAEPGEERFVPVVLEAIAGQPGEYRALLAHDRVGRFTLRLDNPEPASLEYRVLLPPQHEREETAMAAEGLQKAAETTGGRFYREEELHEMRAAIEPRSQPHVERQEVLLWNPLTLLLFVGLVSAEWLVRKFSNLS